MGAKVSDENTVPVVMAFSGSDPTGGAGMLADGEAVAAVGARLAPVITTLTVQDTSKVFFCEPVAGTLVVEQARAVLEDIPISVFKLGMLGSVENVEVVHTLLKDYPDIPVVLDPVLISGDGSSLADDELREAMIHLLFPLVTLVTPNSHEARILAPEADSLDACAQELEGYGCEFVLITGTHEATPKVENRLYANRRRLDSWHWERLENDYHGSGCTLASAIAGLLAHGREVYSAVQEAQEYTWQALRHGRRTGMGQYLPNRFYWVER